MAFFEFPHTRTYDSDLGWLIKKMGELIQEYGSIDAWKAQHETEYKVLADEVEGLINSLVNVITPWDAGIAYKVFSMVSYQGTNYIALQDVPVGIMIDNTEYWQPANNVIQQINAMAAIVSRIQSDKVYYITPEDYGAVGDGITDDTAAVQAAFNAALTGKQLRSFGRGKVYLVTSQINIDNTDDPLRPLDVDFGGAVIRAGAAMASVLCFNNGGINNGDTGAMKRLFADMVIDCNELANQGIWHVAYRNLWMNNITILNCKTIALHVVQGAVYCLDLIIDRRLYTYYDTVGIRLESTDNKFENVRIRDSRIALQLASAANFFINVHAWLINPLCVPGSIYADITGSFNSFSNCYADTYEIAWKFDQARTTAISDSHYFINGLFYNDDTDTAQPTIIYYDALTATPNLIFIGNLIQSSSYYNTTGRKIRFSNIASNIMFKWNLSRICIDNTFEYGSVEDIPNWRQAALPALAYEMSNITTTPTEGKNINNLLSYDGFYMIVIRTVNQGSQGASLYIARIYNGAFVPNTVEEVYKGTYAITLNSDGSLVSASGTVNARIGFIPFG